MVLSESDIASLIAQNPIHDEWPWSTNDEHVIHGHIKDVIAEVRRENRLLDKSEFGHYGSGYASFVDCWLYRDDEDFKFDEGSAYWGIVVLFSTLAPYYVIGEGQKTWEARSSSSYLPSFDFVDQLSQPVIQGLEANVCSTLSDRGMVRIYAHELSARLPRHMSVPTILADPPFRHFDAIFHWED